MSVAAEVGSRDPASERDEMDGSVDFGFQMLRMFASLALVLLVLLAGLYGLRRWGPKMIKSGPSQWIEILAQHPLGAKQFLVVARVRDQLFLLGVSPQGLQLLSPLEEKTANQDLVAKMPS